MLNGLLVINKPKDIGSHNAVYKLRQKLNPKGSNENIKVGHTGTLDPFAEGILVLCLGNATKATLSLQGKDKVYKAELKLGLQTTTDDITGEIISEKVVDETVFLRLNDVIKNYIGTIQQKPPIYSAISVNGKRLYKYARKNKFVEIPTRTVFVKSIQIEEIDKKNNLIKLKIECGSGTYIRALARDIGEDLGVGGTLQNLQRIQVGEIQLENSFPFFDVLNNWTIADIQKNLISLEEIFKNLETVELTDIELKMLLSGHLIFLENDVKFDAHKTDNKQIQLKYNQKIKAVLKYTENKFKVEYLFGRNE